MTVCLFVFVCLLYLTPRAEPAKDRRSLPKGMGRARLGTLCTCLLRMPAILSSRTKFKRPLNAEAEQPHSRSILPPPFVGSTLLSVPYSSERGDCCTEQISVERVWAPRSRISRRLSAKTKEKLKNENKRKRRLIIHLSFEGRKGADPKV